MEFKRKNTVEFRFERDKERPTAYEVHDWLFNVIKIQEDQVEAVQLDGIKNSVFVKFVTEGQMDRVLLKGPQIIFKTNTGLEIKVQIMKSDSLEKIVRVMNLPLEIPNNIISDYFNEYGNVVKVEDEVWSSRYKFPVKNGIRLVKLELKKQIPSYVMIKGYRAQIYYEGQTKT